MYIDTVARRHCKRQQLAKCWLQNALLAECKMLIERWLVDKCLQAELLMSAWADGRKYVPIIKFGNLQKAPLLARKNRCMRMRMVQIALWLSSPSTLEGSALF